MKAIPYSEASRDIARVLDTADNTDSPVLIKRRNGRHVVVMSLAEYNSLEETMYLLNNPENARRLRESIADLEQGKGRERRLVG